MRRFLVGWLSSVLMLFFLCGGEQVFAQSVRGAMAGNVTDAGGAAIPGASITAVDETSGGKSVTKSTSAGVYRFPDLPIGTYTVTVSAQGFQTKVNKGVMVQVNTTSALDVQLPAGEVSETVTVDASAPRIETESSEIGGTVSNKQIEDLPLSLALGVNGMRSPETFEFLVPGTTGPGSATQSNSGNGVFFARLSGGQAYGNETLLDGASVQRSENGSSFDETSPSIEALQEFKVTTSTPSAEFGRTTSGITSFSVKSGTNDFHGTAFAIVKNRVFDANTWFNDGYKATKCQTLSEINCQYSKPADSKYDYGGVFDGPVWIPHLYNGRNHTFFLFAWENYKFKLGGTQMSTVPTAAERQGNFSDILGPPVPGGSPYPGISYNVLLNPCTGQPVFYNQIFDPRSSQRVGPSTYCRTPFANNQVPSSLFSSTALKLLAGLPLPNQAPTSTDVFGFINNYAVNGTRNITNTTYTIRIDQNFSDKSKVFATYDTRQNFALEAIPNLPQPYNSAGYPQTFTTHYSRAGWDYSFTPTLFNHLNLGYNRTNSVNLGSTLGKGPSASSFGIANDYSTFFPRIVFPSPDQPTTWGQQQNGDNIDNGSRVNDSLTWVHGRQSMKFGGDFRFQQYSVVQYNTDTLNFYRDQTAAVSNACCGSGSAIASFLLGEVGNGGQTVYNVHPRWNSHYWAVFFEDDVKFTKNLTVNLGVRYDVDAPRHEALNRTSAFSLTAPNAAASGRPGALVFGTNCNCNTAWADTWYKDIAPRIGFAYVLPGTNNKAVLRGGAAILYGPLQYSDFGSSMLLGFNQSPSFFNGDNPTAGTGGAFTPAFRLDSSSVIDPTYSSVGFPNVSYAPTLDPTLRTSVNGAAPQAMAGEVILPRNGRPSMTDNWSLQLQDELAQDLILTIGYVGQVAQNLHSGFLSNINNIPESDFSYGDRLNLGAYRIPTGGSNDGVNAPYSTFSGTLGQALRPFPQYDYIAGDCCLENLGHSSYHAMLVSLARRFRNGVNLQASYTWSKLLTDADSTIPFSYVTGNGGAGLRQAEGSSNLKLDKAVSEQDLAHQFSLSYLYQLPFGKGRKWLNHSAGLDLLVGGWQLGAIQRYQSGAPISFGCTASIPYYQNCITYTAGPASYGATDFGSDAFKHNKNGPSYFNGQSWFKPAFRIPGAKGTGDPGVPVSQAAFIDQNDPNGAVRHFTPACTALNNNIGCSYDPFSLGNISRVTDAIRGPIYLSEDVSVLKDFHLYERLAFQLKLEAFDIFNRHRMAVPDTSPGDFTGTQGFGIPTATDYGPRTMQVSGRVTF